MNTCFEQSSNFNSNNRIFKDYFSTTAKPVGNLRRKLDAFLYIIVSLCAAFPIAKAAHVLRAIGVAGSLVGFVGIIGAMEFGTLSLGAGLLLGALFIGFEYLCLRPRRK